MPPGGTGAGPLVATFDSIQQNVFTPICSAACHVSAGAPQGLRLDATNSYALLVDVPSTEVPAVLRVKPGDPDNSYLIQKLEGHAAVGAQMPFNGPYLDAAQIAVIRQWITDGALQSGAAASSSFVATAIVPAHGDVLVDAPGRIVIAFSQELDRTRLDASSVHLEALGSAEGSEGASEVPVALVVPRGNPTAVLLEVGRPLADGRYRVVVGAPPETGLAAVGGARLAAGVLVQFEVAAQP